MKRVLLVCHSQTGQLRRCADALVAAMRASGEVEVDVHDPQPVTPYPWPWPVGQFLDVMPESVLELPPPMRPMALPHAKYDLVVLAWQVWYLAPSLPVTAFLQSDAAQVLKGTPVVALCACRNMWHGGWLKLKARLDALGARVVDHIVLVDQGPGWATFVTTPRWMWTGKRNGFGPFPPAGVSEAAILGLGPLGERLAAALRDGRLDRSVLKGTSPAPVTVVRKLVLPEFLAGHLFAFWARLIRGVGGVSKGLRLPFLVLFLAWLWSAILVLLPLVILITIVVRVGFRGWFNARVAELEAPSGGEGA